jgi:hypothetical protein
MESGNLSHGGRWVFKTQRTDDERHQASSRSSYLWTSSRLLTDSCRRGRLDGSFLQARAHRESAQREAWMQFSVVFLMPQQVNP